MRKYSREICHLHNLPIWVLVVKLKKPSKFLIHWKDEILPGRVPLMRTCSVHRHGKDPKDLILADPSFNIEITLLSVNVTLFWQLLRWNYQNPNCLCLHCQMFRRCSSWHNQHQTCQKFKWSDIWILPKLSVLVNVMWFLNPHNFFCFTLEKLSWQWPKTFPGWLCQWGNPFWTAWPKFWYPPLWTCCSVMICTSKL